VAAGQLHSNVRSRDSIIGNVEKWQPSGCWNVMDHYDANGFRSNVGIILCQGDGQLLLGGRAGQAGWQFPQGGIQLNESPREAMYRELEEEIGLQPGHVEILGETHGWVHYKLPEKYVRHGRKPLCIGQRQRWFMLRLVASEEALDLETSDLPEFDRWRWVDYWRPVKEVVYFKRRVYASALAELAPLLFNNDIPPQPRWWPREWTAAPDQPDSADQTGNNP
jgi:putative (di)nucleoside polyphosphate hydrolase